MQSPGQGDGDDPVESGDGCRDVPLGADRRRRGVGNYEVVVEIEDTPFKTSTILPSDQTSYAVPSEILAERLDDNKVKFEVLVREESFNQTATESCFLVKQP